MTSCVLLVEHDDRLLHALGRGLRDAGYLVMPMNDADGAIDLLCLVPFDLVIADVQTLHYATAQRTPGLTALVRVLRGSALLLFTTASARAEIEADPLPLPQGARDLPRLLTATERLLRTGGRRLDRPLTPAGEHFDAGDVDDLAYPPFLRPYADPDARGERRPS